MPSQDKIKRRVKKAKKQLKKNKKIKPKQKQKQNQKQIVNQTVKISGGGSGGFKPQYTVPNIQIHPQIQQPMPPVFHTERAQRVHPPSNSAPTNSVQSNLPAFAPDGSTFMFHPQPISEPIKIQKTPQKMKETDAEIKSMYDLQYEQFRMNQNPFGTSKDGQIKHNLTEDEHNFSQLPRFSNAATAPQHEEFQPVLRRGRGRPPGAKNKNKNNPIIVDDEKDDTFS